MSFDYEDFTTRLFTPLRPHLEEALSCVLGRAPGPDLDEELQALYQPGEEAPSGQEAWERLASSGLIPFSWVGHPARKFGGTPPRENPFCAAQAVVLASDARSVATVEALSEEVFLRLRPWGAAPPQGYSWQIVERGSFVAGPGAFCPWRALKLLLFDGFAFSPEVDEVGRVVRCAPPGWGEVFALALESALLQLCWGAMVSSGARVTRRGPWGEVEGIPEELLGRPFGELLSPFVPFCTIWQEGYGLLGVEEGRAVLLAPLCAPTGGSFSDGS